MTDRHEPAPDRADAAPRRAPSADARGTTAAGPAGGDAAGADRESEIPRHAETGRAPDEPDRDAPPALTAEERRAGHDAERRAERSAQRSAEWRASVGRANRNVMREATSLLGELAAISAELSTPEERAVAAVRRGLELFGATTGVALRVTRAGALEAVGAGAGAAALLERWRCLPLDAADPVAEAARTGVPAYVGSPAEIDARWPAAARALEGTGSAALAVVPLLYMGTVRGVLAFAFPKPREFTRADRSQLASFATRHAQALQQARLYFAERDARAEAEAARADAEAARAEAEAARAEAEAVRADAEAARAEAEAASTAKSDFLAVISHELRTPLTAIVGYTELLSDGIVGPVSPTQASFLGRVRTSSEHLLGLIDELLDFSRGQAGAEVLHCERTTVGDVVDRVAALAAPIAQRKGLAFECHVEARDAELYTDRRKLVQVLLNLAANAIKFSDRGGVTVTAAMQDDRARFGVRDTGIGIAPQHLDRVFDPFWQVHQGKTRPAGGTGLGLSIARQLARRMGGDVTVESRVGEGTEFVVTVARVAPPAPPAAAPR